MHPPGGLRLLLALALITGLSQFLRSATGAIAPELMRDLSMAPEVLGAAGGAFIYRQELNGNLVTISGVEQKTMNFGLVICGSCIFV